MDYRLSGKDAEVIAEGEQSKAKPLILKVEDGDAFLQVIIDQRELRIEGDGGATRRGTWELELVLPRVNEK